MAPPLRLYKRHAVRVEHTVTGFATVDQPPLLPCLFVAKDVLTFLEV